MKVTKPKTRKKRKTIMEKNETQKYIDAIAKRIKDLKPKKVDILAGDQPGNLKDFIEEIENVKEPSDLPAEVSTTVNDILASFKGKKSSTGPIFPKEECTKKIEDALSNLDEVGKNELDKLLKNPEPTKPNQEGEKGPDDKTD